jgi:hypothetical protein
MGLCQPWVYNVENNPVYLFFKIIFFFAFISAVLIDALDRRIDVHRNEILLQSILWNTPNKHNSDNANNVHPTEHNEQSNNLSNEHLQLERKKCKEREKNDDQFTLKFDGLSTLTAFRLKRRSITT